MSQYCTAHLCSYGKRRHFEEKEEEQNLYETGEAREAVINAYQTLEDVDDILDHGGDEELRRLLEKEDREKRKVSVVCCYLFFPWRPNLRV